MQHFHASCRESLFLPSTEDRVNTKTRTGVTADWPYPNSVTVREMCLDGGLDRKGRRTNSVKNRPHARAWAIVRVNRAGGRPGSDALRLPSTVLLLNWEVRRDHLEEKRFC